MLVVCIDGMLVDTDEGEVREGEDEDAILAVPTAGGGDPVTITVVVDDGIGSIVLVTVTVELGPGDCRLMSLAAGASCVSGASGDTEGSDIPGVPG